MSIDWERRLAGLDPYVAGRIHRSQPNVRPVRARDPSPFLHPLYRLGEMPTGAPGVCTVMDDHFAMSGPS